MYKVLRVFKTEENTEIRLAKIDQGYSVGCWDLDEKTYYPGLIIWKHELKAALEKANICFEEQLPKGAEL